MTHYRGPYVWAWLEYALLRRAAILAIAVPSFACFLALGVRDACRDWCRAFAAEWEGYP